MIGRRDFAGVLASAIAWPMAVRAQPAGPVPKAGFLWPGPSDEPMQDREALMLEGLGAAGYRTPKQVELVTRAALG